MVMGRANCAKSEVQTSVTKFAMIVTHNITNKKVARIHQKPHKMIRLAAVALMIPIQIVGILTIREIAQMILSVCAFATTARVIQSVVMAIVAMAIAVTTIDLFLLNKKIDNIS